MLNISLFLIFSVKLVLLFVSIVSFLRLNSGHLDECFSTRFSIRFPLRSYKLMNIYKQSTEVIISACEMPLLMQSYF